MTNEISLDGLPKDLQDKIVAILGRETIPQKPISITEALPLLDISDDKKKQILEVLKPENKQLVKDHERLIKLLQKNRNQPSNYEALETIRNGMDERHGR
jgi:hypothetical protein